MVLDFLEASKLFGFSMISWVTFAGCSCLNFSYQLLSCDTFVHGLLPVSLVLPVRVSVELLGDEGTRRWIRVAIIITFSREGFIQIKLVDWLVLVGHDWLRRWMAFGGSLRWLVTGGRSRVVPSIHPLLRC